MTEQQKEQMKKAASFIRKLKVRKLDMNYVAATWCKIETYPYEVFSDDPKDMKPNECNSAGCVMGWMPRIFPEKFEYVRDDGVPEGSGRLHIRLKGTDHRNLDAMEEFFEMEMGDADTLFGPAQPGHTTPREVARNLEYYAEHEELPEHLS